MHAGKAISAPDDTGVERIPPMVRARQLIAAIIVFALAATVALTDAADRPYPQGTRFPLGLYQIRTADDMATVAPSGWHIAMNWGRDFGWLDQVNNAGWVGYVPVHGQTEAEARAEMESAAVRDDIAWWDLPEDALWDEDKFTVAENLFNWTRQFDPQQRPNAIWVPDYFTEAEVARHAGYIDLFIAGVYPEWAHQPRPWVRWRMESMIAGIERAGFEIGPDYRAGQKIPMATLELFNRDVADYDLTTPREAYHDFWSAIASGAKGIMVMSHAHRGDSPVFEKTWDLGFDRAARNLMADEALSQAILFGDDVRLQAQITSGPPRTCTFRPQGYDHDFSCPSVNVLAKTYRGSIYIITVSSQDRPLEARISGLPAGIESIQVLFEDRSEDDGGGTVPITDTAFTDSYGWLGVHVYRAEMPTGPDKAYGGPAPRPSQRTAPGRPPAAGRIIWPGR